MQRVAPGFVLGLVGLLGLPGGASLALAAPPGIWLNVPFVRQPKEGCGAACIAMILEYWEHKDPDFKCPSPDTASIQRALYSPKAHGIFAADMERYLRREGMRVYAFRGAWSVLRDHLAKGRPLIVCLGEGRALHYVVVVGVDPSRGTVLLNDPAGQKLAHLSLTKFEKKWNAENRWTLLAVPQPQE